MDMKNGGRRITCQGILAFSLSAHFLTACALPPLEHRTTSAPLPDTGTTQLGRVIAPQTAAHPAISGIYPLLDSHAAFAARMLLAQAAERSLDIQCYIWRKDLSGTLLFEALHDAADRGVRVRLLLDDFNTAGLDSTLSALDSHPNIQVRLFNPLAIRNPRWIGYLTDFFRLNRRMHNKSYTADTQATIIGGRNIGDEYFGATEEVAFIDLDVMAVGPIVKDVSTDFTRYWDSASSYPVEQLLPPVDADPLAELTSAASLVERHPKAAAYIQALQESPDVRELLEGRVDWEWASMRMVSDDPAKGLGLAAPETTLPEKLEQIVGEPDETVDLISPYFVPAATGMDLFRAMAKRGVDIRVLTNSLEATDVPIVHAGYAKWRKPLLDAGITLYELRRLTPDTGRRDRTGPFGSSASSLHAKTSAVDRSRVIIGSFNFDPRSARLNTEMGFVIDSPQLAEDLAAAFDTGIPAHAYQVHLSEDGDVYWTERRQEEIIRYDTEPGTNVFQRFGVWVMSIFPIEWLL